MRNKNSNNTRPPSTASAPSAGLLAQGLPYLLAAIFRLFLLRSLAPKLDLASRVEVATPINSHKRLVEGVFLHRQGVDPYSGVIFHETPLVLAAAKLVVFDDNTADIVWILLDLLTAFLVGRVAKEVGLRVLRRQEKERENYHSDAAELLLKAEDVEKMSRYATAAYLYNPYTLLDCAAKTTTSLENLVLASFIFFMLGKRRLPACFFLALAAYKSLYPVMLLAPLCVMLAEHISERTWRQVACEAVLPAVATFSLFLSFLLWISYQLMDSSTNFLWSTYGFILSVPELTPNMGLFWYFFTEMFEHFRIFFVCTFQLNVFIYVIPLTIRLRRDSFLLTFTLLGLTAIFKSYPGYGDVGFYLSLLPVLMHLLPYTKQLFIVACMFLATSVLGPIFYHLWIFNGSANANYYFAASAAFGTAQIFLVTDILFAYVKREYYLVNGYKELKANSDKKDGPKLVLK